MPRYKLPFFIPRTLAELPPAIGLLTGTAFEITDYGGNIATVVNGVWRFEYPFRITWSGRPAVGLVPIGTELQVTDYANQKFISDGTYWRPAQGKVLLAQKSRTTAAAIAVISNSATGQFTIPGGNPKISGGMLIPGSKLRVEAGTVKSGATAAYTMAARLGKNGITASDLALGSIGGAITSDAAGIRMDLVACFSTETNAFFRTGNTPPMGQTQGNMYMSSSTAIDTTADMYVTFDILNGNAADTYSLAFFSIWLEA